MLLLCVDMIVSLALRGLLRARVSATAAALLLLLVIARRPRARQPAPIPAIDTRLGYIVSGDSQVDGIAKSGLEGLSEYVNQRTAASLFEPDAVQPGQTDLSLYPLLYWPITADAPDLTTAQAAALNDYMSRGGIILIDTRDSGSGAGFAPGTEDALRRIARSLDRAAPGAADRRARAVALVLPAVGFSRPLHRRHGLGAARPGPHQ